MRRFGEGLLSATGPPGAKKRLYHEYLFDSIGKVGDNRLNPRPYGSARDLPSVVEMRRQLAGAKLLTRVIARDQRQGLIALEAEMSALCDLADRFYDLLGPRHWIFTDHLPVDAIDELLRTTATVDEAEAGLIEIIADRVRGPYSQMGLLRSEPLRARRAKLERARQHYIDEQWDSCALVLTTVMDGFISDVEPTVRRGLHARDADEMVAWDSLVGHHKGLTAVMPTFLKPCKHRQDEEVFELYRHGIVHGTVVNYNNRVVATKAWNMLGAVVDWAEAKKKAAIPPEPPPTLRGTLTLLARLAEDKRYRDKFEPWSKSAEQVGFDDLDVVQSARRFLASWQAHRWGLMVDFLPQAALTPGSTPGRRAAEAKMIYEHTPLTAFDIAGVGFPHPHVAEIHGNATIGDRTGTLEMRWLCTDEAGDVAKPVDEGARWVLAVYPPHTFIKEGNTSPARE